MAPLALWGCSDRSSFNSMDVTGADFWKDFHQKVPTGDSYTIDHTAFTYVYDEAGRLRLAVKHDKPSEKTAEDIRRLLAQAQAD